MGGGGCGAAARGWRAGRQPRHAPRLRRADGGGVPVGRVLGPFPFAPSRRAGGLWHGAQAGHGLWHCAQAGHAMCVRASPARPVRARAVRAVRAAALCARAAHVCVPVLCARCARAVCRRRVRAWAPACCACPCCACPRCAPSCWVCGVIAQRSSRSCGLRSSTSSTSRGCAGPCFVLAVHACVQDHTQCYYCTSSAYEVESTEC